MAILNPRLNIKLAPKGATYHMSFDSVQGAFRYVVIRAKDLFDLGKKYEDIKQEIEKFDPAVGFLRPNGTNIDNFTGYLDFLLSTYSFIDFIDTDTYHFKELGTDGYDHKFLMASFVVFEDDYKVVSNRVITEKKRLLCSTYSSKDLHMHKSEPIQSGDIKTNNKTSKWSWVTDDIESLTNISFDVSLWRENKLITIYNTTNTHFTFSDHAINENDGNFELIVSTKNLTGSVSSPALYNFYLRSGITNDIEVQILSPTGDPTSVISSTFPTFKMINFDDSYEYKFTFDNEDKVYLYSEHKNNFAHDPVDNSITFTIPDEISTGNHLLTVEKIDNIGNRTGSVFNAPEGIINSSYASFLINTGLVSSPELVSSTWINNTEYLLSWKAASNIERFEIFQGNEMIDSTVNSFLTFFPVILTKADTIINIHSYDYLNNRSLNPLIVNISTYKQYINRLNITSPDSFEVNGITFINNRKPTFIWNTDSADASDLVSYKVSFDGSNWENLISSQYTYLEGLHDGEYTFQVVGVHSNGIEGDINTFSFTLKTDLPSYPIFTEETLNAPAKILEETKLTWLEIDDTDQYEVCFNESFVDDLTEFTSITNNCIDFENSIIKVEPGINTLLVRSKDIFGNKSKVSRHTFLVLDPNTKTLTETSNPITLSKIVSKDILSSRVTFKTFNLNRPLDATYCNFIFKTPNGKTLEYENNYTDDTFTNTVPMSINGLYTLELKWYSEINNNSIYLKDTELNYLYNSYQFNITNLKELNNKISWDPDANSVYAYYEYSLALTGSPYFSFNLFHGDSIDLKDKLPAGDYKFRIKGYDSFNNYLCDTKEITFNIYDSISLEKRKIQFPGYPNHFLNIILNTKTQSFYIQDIVDDQDNIISGFVEFKRSIDPNFTLYKDKFILSTTEDYNFIFNQFS